MRLSHYFWQTYKENPADAEIVSHRLMMRAGLIHKTGSGLYSYLPMGLRSLKKVEDIIRQELEKVHCHELAMTIVTPSELWKESGRWDKMSLMLKAKDNNEKEICLSPTNEEAITDIFRKTTFSYKQLPLRLYQINTKYRDEIRPRFGLMRCREFMMKDAYSFHASPECLRETYEKMYVVYENIFKRIGLDFVPVEADAGDMGEIDSQTHEFQVLAKSGEDQIVYCKETGYAANIEKAKTKRSSFETLNTKEALVEVSTPNKSTIEDVCTFLKIPQSTSLKSLVYRYGEKEKFCLVLLLGDDSLNELKLENHLGTKNLRAATDNEIQGLGLVKGFIGPVGAQDELELIFDASVSKENAYTVGGSKENVHFQNFIPARDLKSFVTVDLRMTTESDLTLDGKKIEFKRGIEVGHIFELGQKYSQKMKANILLESGKSFSPHMGCYGIGVSRTLAAAIEQGHDENGIIWPKAIAPYDFHFVAIAKSDEAKKIAEEIYLELKEAGLDVLYDDRKVGPGFKFKDADLLGLPIKITFGERDYNKDKSIEIGNRKTAQTLKVQRETLVQELKKAWESY